MQEVESNRIIIWRMNPVNLGRGRSNMRRNLVSHKRQA